MLASTVVAWKDGSKWIPGPTDGTDALAAQGLANLAVYKAAHRTNASTTCTLETASRRQEWDSLTTQQKLAYISAVQCMSTLPSLSNPVDVPGARNRIDDFTVTHINLTHSVHGSGLFLPFHRYFLQKWETALREECNYNGSLPYVSWGRYTNSVIGAPIFSGGADSFSNNGAPLSPHPQITLPGPPPLNLNSGPGGGCISQGAFASLRVHLGPLGMSGIGDNVSPPNPRTDGLGYNPRCIRTDLSVELARGASDANTTKLILGNDNIGDFQDEMQGFIKEGQQPFYGVHTSGHLMVGSDPIADFFASPAHPWFFSHHAMIGMAIWQNLDIEKRTNTIAGTITYRNMPPSRNATLDDIIDVGVNDAFQGIKVRDAMSTTEGPFCYIYV
ncbi:uncharacterized protein MYCGRDRAFT_51282 [Zymoseptoria tritici IPO323]|uniref:Tyrosinase copper-binding domain-containing protein n=1 Tax=Zymoseptoria tritici (strain CBS 115943 / IPO323) TaxID=336722 RepID=F9XPY9_ZYMTI|nr:uncharacterized protein MYCGRDRAFT_51282 [Zymoseptoria tritici IPO323]EGP82749.1 hypothetical protein MYCGRDRAFT_51282 [Zymoseptoria tritici IPO323]